MSMIDIEIVRIAERRKNLVTRSQLETLGLTSDQIERRLRRAASSRVLLAYTAQSSRLFPADVRRLAVCLAIPGVSSRTPRRRPTGDCGACPVIA